MVPTCSLAHNNLCMRDCPRPRSERAIKKDGERSREGGRRSPSFLPPPRLELPFRQKVAPRPPTAGVGRAGGRASGRLAPLVSRQQPSDQPTTNQPCTAAYSNSASRTSTRPRRPREKQGASRANRAEQTRHSFRRSEKMTSLELHVVLLHQFAVKMRLRDFLEKVEIPKLVISNNCKMALGSSHKV